jgi:hypothetical protein
MTSKIFFGVLFADANYRNINSPTSWPFPKMFAKLPFRNQNYAGLPHVTVVEHLQKCR